MAKKDMAIILGGILLPKFTKIRRITDPNETDNVSLGGTLSTDFINVRRSWLLTWDLLPEEDFTDIYNLYEEQYELRTYKVLQIDSQSVYAPVKINISKQDIKYNGSYLEKFKIILKEQYAIS